MKKAIWMGAVIIGILLTGHKVLSKDDTLFLYFGGRVGNFPSIEERMPMAKKCGIVNYRGTKIQNERLLDCLRTEDIKITGLTSVPLRISGNIIEGEEDILGIYNPVTAYQSRLTSFLSASAATISVVSTNDKAGNAIALSNISSSSTVKIYLNLDPGGATEEPVVCTGVTATSWTGCTRGLVFQGSSEVSSSTIAVAHNAGTPIIITNISQFFSNYVSTDGDQIITGTTTFANRLATTTVRIGPGSTTYAKCLEIRNGDANPPFICYNETSGSDSAGRFLISHDGVNSFELVTSTSGLSTGGIGININASNITFDPAATSTSGLGFMRDLAIIATTTNGGIRANEDGLVLNTSSTVTWYGASTWTFDTTNTVRFGASALQASSTGNNIPISMRGGGLDFGWVRNISTFVTTTGEAIDGRTTPRAVALASSTGLLLDAEADVTSTVDFVGFVTQNLASGARANLITHGIVSGFSGLVGGEKYYVSDTPGTISTSPGASTTIPVGTALTTTTLLIKHMPKVAHGDAPAFDGLNGTNDRFVDIGFRPSMIILKGRISAIGSNSGRCEIQAIFVSTTAESITSIYQDGLGTAITSSNIQTYYPDSLTCSSTGANTNDATLSIFVIRERGFVIRLVDVDTAGAGGTVSISSMQYIAIE